MFPLSAIRGLVFLFSTATECQHQPPFQIVRNLFSGFILLRPFTCRRSDTFAGKVTCTHSWRLGAEGANSVDYEGIRNSRLTGLSV